MSCSRPLLARPTGFKTENGKTDYQILGLGKGAVTRPGDILIPCGKCIGCRLEYSRQWADRMILELDHSKKAVFLTLTYNDDHVPVSVDENGEVKGLTLDKRDMQLFMKRLRKAYSDRELRFYGAGEYGSKTWRPHMHLIVFGLGLDDFNPKTLVKLGVNELHQPHYTCPEIQRAWSERKYIEVPVIGKRGKHLKKLKKEYYYDPIGYVVVAEVSWKTCAYVSRYVQKKVYSDYQSFLDKFGVAPEFSLMSRDPGLGAYFLDDHPDQADCSQWFAKGKESSITPGRFFEKYLEKINPVLYNQNKEERRNFAKDRDFLKLMQTDNDEFRLYEIEENDLLSKGAFLTHYRDL